jgi:hypothetical protein
VTDMIMSGPAPETLPEEPPSDEPDDDIPQW